MDQDSLTVCMCIDPDYRYPANGCLGTIQDRVWNTISAAVPYLQKKAAAGFSGSVIG